MVRDNPLESFDWLIVMASSNLVLAEHYLKCAALARFASSSTATSACTTPSAWRSRPG